MSTENHKPATVIGIRRDAVIEIVLYLAVALALDYLFFGRVRFRDVQPHPFWPIVLLAAIQYGTGEALLAAGLATLSLLAGNIPAQQISQDTYDYLIVLIKEPVLWFTAAIVLGELRVRHIKERQKLQLNLSEALKRGQDIANAYEWVARLKENLEERVAGQMRTAINMYQAARSLERHDPNKVLLGVVEIVHAVINPEKFSLFLLRENVLEMSISEGWTANDNLSRSFTADARLFQEVMGRQRIVCVANAGDELVLGNEGVLAGPLIDRETGDVMGMMKIEKMGFFDLHFSNVQTFQVLCNWIADAYSNARRFEMVESEGVFENRTNLYSYSFFRRQMDYIQKLGARVGFDVSVILLRMDNEGELPEAEQLQIGAIVKSAVANILRVTDMAFDYRRAGYQFAIVLPKTNGEGAHLVGDRLMAQLRQQAPRVTFTYAIQTFDHKQPGGRIGNEAS